LFSLERGNSSKTGDDPVKGGTWEGREKKTNNQPLNDKFPLEQKSNRRQCRRGSMPRGNVAKTMAGECAAFATPGSTAPVCLLAGWKDPTRPKAG